MLIDTHAHLTDERLDPERVMAEMAADGLGRIITVGYDLESSERCVEIAEKHENVWCAVGIHPSDSQKLTSDPTPRLLELSKSPKCVAIGEIGLDYHYDDTDREVQKYWLVRQLELVSRAGLPVCFHVRDAYEDMEKVLDSYGGLIKSGAVMHCFSGSLETAKNCVRRGFYVSFSGSVTFKNAKKFYDIVPAIPRDRLLAETDSPYLAPHPHRGETDYPKYVRLTVEKLAEILGADYAEIEELTARNAFAIFTKMK